MNRIRIIGAIIAALTISISVGAQSKQFAEVYKKYDKNKEVVTTSVGSFLLATARMTSEDIPKGLKGIKSIMIEDRSKISQTTAEGLDTDMSRIVKDREYVMMTAQEEKGHKLYFYFQSAPGSEKIKNFLIYVTGEKVISATEFAGEFDRNEMFIRQMLEGKYKNGKQQ